MKSILLIIIFVFAINTTNAQLKGQAKIDSLFKELPKIKEDSNAVKLLTYLSFEYSEINPTLGLKYGEKGLNIAKKINWKKGQANCYVSLGRNIYASKKDFNKALDYFNISLNIYKELGDKAGEANNFWNIGNIYRNQTNYAIALKYYFKSLEIYEELGDKSSIASIQGNIGNIYTYQSNYPKALDFFLKSLKINEELGNKSGVASCLGNIGNIYIYLSDYTKALEYFDKVLKIFEELDNKNGIAISLGNIGSIYYDQSNYPKALDYYLKSLKINEEIGDKPGIAINLTNIANIYDIQSKFSEAIDYYNKAMEIDKELGNTNGLAYDLGNIGGLYLSQAIDSTNKYGDNKVKSLLNKETNLIKSIDHLNKAIEIFTDLGHLNDQSYFLDQLSKAYQFKGDYKKSLETFKKHKQIQDSIFSMEKARDIANLESRRENELKDAEIALLKVEKENQQFRVYILIGSIIVFVVALIFAIFRYNEKKKQSIILTHQKEEITQQKDVLEEKNNQISASIRYAATIQNAILPWQIILEKSLKNYFILYKPKDIVSGDSYWFQEVNGIKFVAVIDCTGHGVPGAMLTVVASTVLDDAVLEKKYTDTGNILTYMNEKVTEVLNQQLSENNSRDGMEVALLAIHPDKLQFSGAGRPLYFVKESLEIFKTDKNGIAGNKNNKPYSFSSILIENYENSSIYLTSDGFADQMNIERKKYSTKRFISKLEEIAKLDCKDQKSILEKEITNYQGNETQMDDITVLGISF